MFEISVLTGSGAGKSRVPGQSTQCDNVSDKPSRSKEVRIKWKGDIYNKNAKCCDSQAFVSMGKQDLLRSS